MTWFECARSGNVISAAKKNAVNARVRKIALFYEIRCIK
jgi:hypothetical protein